MVSEQAFSELGLSAEATDLEVKAAWRRLVSRWHPDRNDSAQAVAKVQRLNQAFEAIRRARQEGAEDDAAPDAPQPDADAEADTAPAGAPEPGPQGQASAEAAQPEADSAEPPIRRKLRLSLEEAAAGCIKLLRGRRTPTCAACAGLGYLEQAHDCASCRGSGQVTRGSIWFGWSGNRGPCTDCAGTGRARLDCAPCGGSGKLAVQSYQLQVRIPPGVRHGDLLHVAARRARGNPAPADLEIEVAVTPHPFLRLDPGGDLHCELPVDGFAWMAQRPVAVPTPYGEHTLALSREQRQYLLPGQGFPRTRGGERGDLLVEVVPVFPERFSTDQEILFDQLLATSSGAAMPERLRQWQAGLRRRTPGKTG